MASHVQARLWKSVTDQVFDKSISAIVGAIVGIVGATFGLVFAPYGDAAQEWLNPTSATVRGRIVKDQVPADGVMVTLDGMTSDATGGLGLFYIPEVADGLHDVVVLDDGMLALKDQIMVPKRVAEYPIADIELAAAPQPPSGEDALGEGINPDFKLEPTPTPAAIASEVPTQQPTPAEPQIAMASPESALPPSENDGSWDMPSISPRGSRGPDVSAQPSSESDDIWEMPPGIPSEGPGPVESTPTSSPALVLATTPVTAAERAAGVPEAMHRVEARIQAPAALMAEIDHVTYYLDPSFTPSVVSRYAAEDGFLLSFVTPGPFTLAAKITLADGTVIDVERPIEF